MRIVFIGSGDVGLPTLQALLKSDYPVVGVVTQPDKPVGRAQLIEPPPIKKALAGAKIPILQPPRIKERKAIEAAVEAHKFKPDIDTLVLDGIPRNVGQAEIMEEMIDVKRLFHLACPDRETLFYRLKKRALKENRLDDANEEVIQRRLDIYEKESRPVLSHYSQELVTVVDATQPPAKVLLDILQSVNDGVYEPAAV